LCPCPNVGLKFHQDEIEILRNHLNSQILKCRQRSAISCPDSIHCGRANATFCFNFLSIQAADTRFSRGYLSL
jgi:hypothetical protein